MSFIEGEFTPIDGWQFALALAFMLGGRAHQKFKYKAACMLIAMGHLISIPVFNEIFRDYVSFFTFFENMSLVFGVGFLLFETPRTRVVGVIFLFAWLYQLALLQEYTLSEGLLYAPRYLKSYYYHMFYTINLLILAVMLWPLKLSPKIVTDKQPAPV